MTPTPGVLPVDPDALAACVGCGLCLAHCPTYRVTGEEGLSPRGRIAAMRAVDAGAPADETFAGLMETCVQCRACETACPSSVPFGNLMERTREFLATGSGAGPAGGCPPEGSCTPEAGSAGSAGSAGAAGSAGSAGSELSAAAGSGGSAAVRSAVSAPAGRSRPRGRTAGGVPAWQRAAYRVLEHHRLLIGLSRIGAVAQRAGLVPGRLARRLALPTLPLRSAALTPTGNDVWLFTGCVMDAWLRRVHRAAIAVIGACGAGVALPDASAGAACCGALHGHAGLRSDASRLARSVMRAFPGSAPILVDSAGCGAALKGYGELLGTDEARAFAARVLDVHEWLAARSDQLPAATTSTGLRIAVQDPCHLRHVQRAEASVRTVLAPYGTLVELTDEGRCCGAGGAYSALQPELAGRIRTQKLGVIALAGADVVASANPGCALWLAAAGVPVRHPLEIVADAAGLEVGDGR